jgi:hypothetical protein
MLAVAFDTLKLARKWESAGVAPKQAQEMTAALSESLAEYVTVGNLATKDDIERLAVGTKGDIAKLETKIAETKGELKAEIQATKAEILKWMFGAMGTQTVILLAALFGLLHSAVKF